MTISVQPINLAAILLVCRDLPEWEQQDLVAYSGRPYSADDAARQAANFPGPAWCFDAEGQPIVVGGFIPMRPGVYRAWFYATSVAWERHGRGVSRIVRKLIASMLVEQAHRIEVVTLADRSRARRWYETIGLRFESLMVKYGVYGEDAVTYVATRTEAK